MPSFDVVSKIDLQELDNALNQAKKELGSRYDFQGTFTSVELLPDKRTLLVKSESVGRLEAAKEVVLQKLAKRGVSLRSLEYGKIETGSQGHVKQTLALQQGIAQEKAKQLIAVVKESKLKVTAQIQGEALRVSSKSRDELQSCISLLRAQQETQEIDLQFNNFRE